MTTTLPVSFYLRELNGEGGRSGRVFGGETTSEIEARVAQAHARGVLEGRAAAQVENDAVLAANSIAFTQKMKAERQAWASDHGALIGNLILSALADVQHGIAEQVGQILKPLLADCVRAKAVEQLSQTLEGLLVKGDYAKIAISGPGDLLSKIRARLGDGKDSFSFAEADGVDVAVSADGTILETRIQAWADAIEEDSP